MIYALTAEADMFEVKPKCTSRKDRIEMELIPTLMSIPLIEQV
jgi:hypothetical protein